MESGLAEFVVFFGAWALQPLFRCLYPMYNCISILILGLLSILFG